MAQTLEFGNPDPEVPERRRRARAPLMDFEETRMAKMTKADAKLEMQQIEDGVPPQRAQAAATMSLRGFSYPEIAKHLGYFNAGTARSAVIAVIADQYNPEDNRSLRMKQSARLDRLLKSVFTQATDPEAEDQLAYSRRASEILQDISRLHGVNAPTQLALTNPDADKIEELVRHLQSLQNGGMQEEEGDILALDEGPDGTFADSAEVEEDGYGAEGEDDAE